MLETKEFGKRKIRGLSRSTYWDQCRRSHSYPMDEQLTPKELAKAKLKARKTRIRNIRRRVAITAATLTAVFSGVILARSQINQPVESSQQVALVQEKSNGEGSEEVGTAEMLVAVALGAAANLTGDDDDDHDEDDEGYGGSSYSSSASTSSSSTPLVTSQS